MGNGPLVTPSAVYRVERFKNYPPLMLREAEAMRMGSNGRTQPVKRGTSLTRSPN